MSNATQQPQKPLISFCCECGKKLGQGIKKGEKKKGYDNNQEDRRFHATCWHKAKEREENHNRWLYEEEGFDTYDRTKLYDMKKHYNYKNKAIKKTETSNITRALEYEKHQEAIRQARAKSKKKFRY
jgi:hypothetical protein